MQHFSYFFVLSIISVTIALISSCKTIKSDVRAEDLGGKKASLETQIYDHPFTFNVTHFTNNSTADRNQFVGAFGEENADAAMEYFAADIMNAWNEKKVFPLVAQASSDALYTYNYTLKIHFQFIPKDPGKGPQPLGAVTWNLDTEYAPHVVKTLLILATEPINEKIPNFFGNFDVYPYPPAFLGFGLSENLSPLRVSGCLNPGRGFDLRAPSAAAGGEEKPVEAITPGARRKNYEGQNQNYDVLPKYGLMARTSHAAGSGVVEPGSSALDLREVYVTTFYVNLDPNLIKNETVVNNKIQPVPVGTCHSGCALLDKIYTSLQGFEHLPSIRMVKFEVTRNKSLLPVARKARRCGGFNFGD